MELYSILLQTEQRCPDNTAYVYEGSSFTYREFLQGSNIVGHGLIQRGFAERQNVALLTPNTPHFVFGLFGLLGAGHIAVPLNPLLNPHEIGHLIRHAEPRVLLYDPLLKEKAEQAVRDSGHPVECLSISDLLRVASPDTSSFTPTVGEDDPSMILYTSGTTGDPKGVVLTHKNIYSNTVSFSRALDLRETDTFLCCLPLYHTYAMTVIVFGSLLMGARVILYPQFVPQRILEAFVTEPNIVFAAVPPMFFMVTRFAPDDIAGRHHLRFMVSGGGPLPVDVAIAFQKKFNHEILEGYGLTETSPVVAYNRPGQNQLGTIGPPLPGVEVEIRNEAGEVLGPNQIGELCVRGDLVMKEYYKNEEETRRVFYPGGWLRTGDLASIGEDGYIKIVGRQKDLIVCGGENIYPREIEETLMKYPGVLEAAVVAKPNKLRSEVPQAFVVLAEEAKGKVTESDLRKFCREHLAEYKIPEEFTFLDAMPKTAKGTIEKKELRRWAAAGIDAQSNAPA